MKVKSFIILALLACVMTSCFDETGTQTTPEIMFGYLYVNPQLQGDSLVISAKDTLYDYYDTELAMTYVDTMQLGDTVMFPALFSSYMNNLVNIQATFDTTRVEMWFGINTKDENIKKALTAESQPEKGVLYFNPMYNMVSFPIYIVPQEVGSHIIKISVTSDSQYPTNSSVFTLPVKQ